MVMVYHLCNWRSNLVDVMGTQLNSTQLKFNKQLCGQNGRIAMLWHPEKLLKCPVRGPTVPKPLEE